MSTKSRLHAKSLFAAGLAAADPTRAVQMALKAAPIQPALIVAIGKAARLMAKAARDELDGPVPMLVVTNYENAGPLDGAEVLTAGHPIPDENSVKAARRVLQCLQDLPSESDVLLLISGGGSALVAAPVSGITLSDKAVLSRLMLASGATINEMNLVRQQISEIKGGGLLRLSAPANIQALILSDVIGNDLRAVASGPTVAPIGTRKQARELLADWGLLEQVPVSISALLNADQAPRAALPAAKNILIGSNEISVGAMAKAAPEARRAPQPLVGDVGAAAQQILQHTIAGIYLFGGETTVDLRGTGRGGRNQELALRVALGAKGAGWRKFVFLSGGTDGRDGPTDAAGGIVDEGSIARMHAAGIDPHAALRNNDSYHALQASNDLLKIGATGTNVADLQVLIII